MFLGDIFESKRKTFKKKILSVMEIQFLCQFWFISKSRDLQNGYSEKYCKIHWKEAVVGFLFQ